MAVRNGGHICVVMHTASLTRLGAGAGLIAGLQGQLVVQSAEPHSTGVESTTHTSSARKLVSRPAAGS